MATMAIHGYGLGRVNEHIDKLHSHAKRLGNLVEKHKETLACVFEHAAYQAEGMVAASMAALADHYLGKNGVMQVAGIPIVGLAGVAVGALSLAFGAHPIAGHIAAVAVSWESIGLYNLVGSALQSMSK